MSDSTGCLKGQHSGKYPPSSGQPTVLVTGANGFVGRALTQRVYARSAVRTHNAGGATAHTVSVGDIDESTQWHGALAGVEVVVHLAARVHVMQEHESNALAAFRRVNVAGTLQLAREAHEAGAKRFIYLSSIKVNGESTAIDRPFSAQDPIAPRDAYGISKAEAEQGLRRLADRTGLEVVIIRPPLVYGPGVKANFLALLQWLSRGLPLPFGAVKNRRSMVALDNLVDLIVTCLEHPNAPGRTWFVSDGEDLSTPDLVHRAALALDVKVRLWPLPPSMLSAMGVLLGKAAMMDRLCSSLCVDIGPTKSLLGWSPVIDVDAALRSTALAFKASAHGNKASRS